MSKNVSSWLTIGVAVVGGVALFVGSWLGGHPVLGLGMFALMLAFSAGTVLVARGSETVRHLLDGRDERITAIDVRATAASAIVTILAIIAGAVVELAHGRSGEPYTWLAGIAGLTYIVSVIALRFRG